MMEWGTGIFTVISLMVTVIGIVIATRFLYIDSQYLKIIQDCEKFIAEQEENMFGDEKHSDEHTYYSDASSHISSYNRAIGFYKAKQNNNKKEGVLIDFFSMFSLVIIALITTSGYFENEFLALQMLIFILFVIPLVHFIKHIRTLSCRPENSI